MPRMVNWWNERQTTRLGGKLSFLLSMVRSLGKSVRDFVLSDVSHFQERRDCILSCGLNTSRPEP